MSVFEQCLPYRELGLDRDLTCEVLNDDEDLLHQVLFTVYWLIHPYRLT